MFGYKAENKFAQGVWYVFATSVAALTLAINNYKYHRKDHDPTYLHDFSNQYVSPYIIYHDWYPSYLYNLKTGHRTLTDVHWICKSSDGDSLACVYEKGMLHLIDHDGKKVMDKEFPYGIRNNDYCFHNGLCIMYDENGRFGLIDKQGKWSVEPQYYEIEYDTKGFWLVQDRDWNYGLLDRNSIFITPPSYSSITDIGHNRYHCEGAYGSVIPDSKGNEYGEKL